MLYHAERSVGLHPRLTAFNLYLLAKSRFDWKVTDGFRSNAEQDGLYAIGRTVELGSAVITDAKGGQSAHNFRLAEDLALTLDKGATVSYDYGHPAWAELSNLVAAFNALGLGKLDSNIKISSGVDRPHIQVHDWQANKNWVQTVALVCAGLLAIVVVAGR